MTGNPAVLRIAMLLLLTVFLLSFTVFILRINANPDTPEVRKIKDCRPIFSSVSFALTVILFMDGMHRGIIAVSVLVSAIAGLSAYLAGKYISSAEYTITGGRKTAAGSFLFFIVSAAVISSALYFGKEYLISGDMPLAYFIFAAILIALIITVFESLSRRGFDAFLVPVITCLLLFIFLQGINYDLLKTFLFGIVLSLIVAVLSYRVRFLTLSGSAATFLLAAFIFGFGGIKWSIPIMAFFILSSLLSKFRKNINSRVEEYFEKSGVRDYMQVLANGGVGGILVVLNLIYTSDLFYLVYISSLAAVCADTWATEIGTLRKTRTYNILTLKPVHQGVSGGISIAGTAGALMGSVVIALSGSVFVYYDPFSYFTVVILSGLFGSFLDSLLGATIQAQFECSVCGKVTEKIYHCKETTLHKSGLSWMNNDIVNLLAGFGGILFLLIFQKLIL